MVKSYLCKVKNHVFPADLKTFFESLDFEFKDGLFFHSPLGLAFCYMHLPREKNQVKSADWLVNLQDDFSRKGIRLVFIWEDAWGQKPEVVKSRVLALLGRTNRIHGRQTKAKRISITELNAFLEENHLNVATQAKYKYGLFLKDELVAVASFSRPRFIEREGKECKSFELLRFCNKRGFTVVGGLSKLLKGFVKEIQPDDIMSYADRDWSDGAGYERLGFELEAVMSPTRFWIDPKDGQRCYEKRLLMELGQGEEIKDSEAFLLEKGYLPVCNAGSLKYVKHCLK